MKAIEQLGLFGVLDQPHRTALEAEFGELGVTELEENVHEGVAEAAEVEVFHSLWTALIECLSPKGQETNLVLEFIGERRANDQFKLLGKIMDLVFLVCYEDALHVPSLGQVVC